MQSSTSTSSPEARLRPLYRRVLGALGVAVGVATAGAPTVGAAEAYDYDEDTSVAMYPESPEEITPKDTTSATDDKSVGVPTGWWVYSNISAAQVGNFLSTNGARLTDIEIYSVSSGVPKFTVTMVKNSGSYAVPGWWWYYGQTFAQVGSLLSSNNARLIDLTPYDIGGGDIRYAVAMVSNTGSTARVWSYLSGVTSTQIANHISSSGHRMIDLDSYGSGTGLRYSAVFVANTGTDAKGWQWWVNQTSSQVSSRLSAANGRLVHINRTPTGTFDIILVTNTGGDAFYWHWAPSFTTITAVLNHANQLGERVTDIDTYTVNGQRRYAAVFIDNSNTATQRIRSLWTPTFTDANGNPSRGIFESYLKQVSGSVVVDLNSARSTEVASALKVLHLAHTMRRITEGTDSLGSAFTYYQYPNSPFNASTKDACPITSDETAGNVRSDFNLEKGADEMMRISDNRTTRGILLRYGRAAIQGTAATIGLPGTFLRSDGNHNNLGCFYYNVETEAWTDPGNDSTAADLAKIYENAWNSGVVKETGRSEFFESANPGTSPGAAIQAIINDEAAKQNKSAIASSFGALWRSYGKGGSYSGQLSNGQSVRVLSGAGLVRIPIQSRGGQTWRNYVVSNLYSDVPVGTGYPSVSTYEATLNKVNAEIYREVIRSALLTW